MKKIIYIFLIVTIFSLGCNFIKADNINLDTKYDNMSTECYSCGNGFVDNIPTGIVKTVHIAYIVLQIVVPIILVVLGTIDFTKAIALQKEDEIKKAQMLFIKRLIYAVLVFFIFVIVKLLISVVADTGKVMECADCFLNEKCEKSSCTAK